MSSPATRRSSRGAPKAGASPGPSPSKGRSRSGGGGARLSSSPATAIAIAQRRAAAAAAGGGAAEGGDDDSSSVWSRRPGGSASAAGAKAGGGRGKGRVVAPAKGSVPIDPDTGLEDLDNFFRAATEVAADGGAGEGGPAETGNKKTKGRVGKKVRHYLYLICFPICVLFAWWYQAREYIYTCRWCGLDTPKESSN